MEAETCGLELSPKRSTLFTTQLNGVSSQPAESWHQLVTVPAMAVSALSWIKIDRACAITRDLVAKNPLTPDYSPDYMAVQGWPFVVALYSGVEQALKVLLLAQPNPQFALADLKKEPYRHNLVTLFAALPSDDRDHIEWHFREHWSLYEYNTHGQVIHTAEDFIVHINSGGKQGGSVSWRYVLVEETMDIPAMNLWTMCEIWHAVCCRVKTKALERQGDCSRLSRILASNFRWLVLRTIPVPYDEFTDDVNEWIVHKGGRQLVAWIDLFVKANHNNLHGVQAPDRLRPELAKMADRALKQMASDSADPDEAQLLHRIQTDPYLVWNPADGTFGSEAR